MNKLQIKWLALGAVSALAFVGCVAQEGDESVNGDVGGADVALDPVAGEVSVKVALDKTNVNSTERVMVKVTLTNDSNHAVRLLSWYAPAGELEEDVFSVTRGAEDVEFIGPHYKRAAPVADDFVVLDAGKSVTRDVDLSDFYDFSKGTDYKIKYNSTFLRDGAKESVTLSSNEVGLWIMGRTSANAVEEKLAPSGAIGETSGLTFSKCTVDQSNTVTQALGAASTMTNNAVSYFNGSSSLRYTTWFGANDATRWTTVKNNYAKIKDSIDTKPVTVDCGCKKTYYAYVYPNQPYKVYVCKAFWTAPLSGTDSKAGTLIHELSHFTAVAGTDDWGYGHTNAKNLANTDPAKAIDNADNHEYFAENTPAQN